MHKRADLALELQGSKIIEFLKKSNANGPVWESGPGSSKWMLFLLESLRKRTSLRVWAWKLQMDAFLIGTLKETEQSESLRVWASELQIDAFLIRILKETKQSESLRDQSENLSVGAPNGCFSC